MFLAELKVRSEKKNSKAKESDSQTTMPSTQAMPTSSPRAFLSDILTSGKIERSQQGGTEFAHSVTPRTPRLEMVQAKDHPRFHSYFKMFKIGLPIEQIEHRSLKEGVDISLIDFSQPNKMIPYKQELKPILDIDSIPIHKHAELAKYYRMLKMGIPKQGVMNKMTEEGFDSAVLDRDPNELVSTTTSYKLKSMDEKKVMEGNRNGQQGSLLISIDSTNNNTNVQSTNKPNNLKRRKKLFWQAITANDEVLRRGHSYTSTKGDLMVTGVLWKPHRNMMELLLPKQFSALFLQDVSNMKKTPSVVQHNARSNRNARMGGDNKALVSIYDSKRAQNICIALSRYKGSLCELREKILHVDCHDLSTNQLISLRDRFECLLWYCFIMLHV